MFDLFSTNLIQSLSNHFQFIFIAINQLLFLLIKMDKIVDKLYLGNLKGASDMQALHKAGITHILQVASGIRPFFPKDFKYKVINVTDTSQSSLIRHFPAAVQFIKEGISKGGVLVHCYAGVSRSASCVIAYLMQEKDMTFTEAFAFASKRRPIIFPNMGFQRQLCEYEKLLHLHKSYSSPTRVNKLAAKVALGAGGNSSSSLQRPPANGGSASMNATVANFTGQAGLVGKGGANKEIVKQIHRSLLQGIPSTNPKMFSADSSAQDFLFDQEVPQNDEFQRVTYFDRSNAFCFEDDKLGRLAEINKTQLDSALRDLNSFRRTDQGFNRQPYIRGGVKEKVNGGTNNQSKASFNTRSPQKATEKNLTISQKKSTFNAGPLRLEKQAISAENMWETNVHTSKRASNHKLNAIRSPDGRILVKNPEFNDYCQNEGSNKQHTQGGRPKTNQSQRKPFGQPTGSFDNAANSHNVAVKLPHTDISIYAPNIASGSLAGLSSEDLNKKVNKAIGIPDSPSIKKNISQDLFNSIGHSSNARHLYVCVGCNTPLFTNKDIVDHTTTATTSSSTAHRNQLSSKCTSFYVKQREWMLNQDGSGSTSNLKKISGTLTCYRKVCKRKLGTFSLQGLRCNCGHYVKPAFQINKNKVKPVTTSSNIAVIGNNINTNHASNSDLSKYSTGVDPFVSQNTAPSVLHTPDMRIKAQDSLTKKHPGGSASVGDGQNGLYYSSMFKKSTEKLLTVNMMQNNPSIPIPVRNHNSFHQMNPSQQGPITGITIGSQLSTKYQKRNAVDFQNNQFVPPSQVTAQSLLSQDPFSSFSKVFIIPNDQKGLVGRAQQAQQNSADTVAKVHTNTLRSDSNWHKSGHHPSKSYNKASGLKNEIIINANNSHNTKGTRIEKLKVQNLSFAGQSHKSHVSDNMSANTAIYFNKGNQSSYSHNVTAKTNEGTGIPISGVPSQRSKAIGSINVTSSFSTNNQIPSNSLIGRKAENPQRMMADRKLKFK